MYVGEHLTNGRLLPRYMVGVVPDCRDRRGRIFMIRRQTSKTLATRYLISTVFFWVFPAIEFTNSEKKLNAVSYCLGYLRYNKYGLLQLVLTGFVV